MVTAKGIGNGYPLAALIVKREIARAMARLFENTRECGLVASKSGAYRNVLRICPPLCMQMDDVPFFEKAINRSFESL